MSESTKSRRRAMLALVALADLPTPYEVRFYRDEALVLSLDTVADGLAWCAHLGADDADTYRSEQTGRRHLREGVIHWHGWRVQILAYDQQVEQLDADTRVALEAIAEDGGESR